MHSVIVCPSREKRLFPTYRP